MIKQLLLFVSLITVAHIHLNAQTSYPFKVTMDRMLWHDKVDAQQKKVLEKKSPIDESIELQITDALIRRVDEIQQEIELDSTYTRNLKIKYLLSVESMLKEFNMTRGNRDYPSSMAPALVAAFEKAMALDRKNESIEPVISESSY